MGGGTGSLGHALSIAPSGLAHQARRPSILDHLQQAALAPLPRPVGSRIAAHNQVINVLIGGDGAPNAQISQIASTWTRRKRRVVFLGRRDEQLPGVLGVTDCCLGVEPEHRGQAQWLPGSCVPDDR
jgi:hypothetical protein